MPLPQFLVLCSNACGGMGCVQTSVPNCLCLTNQLAGFKTVHPLGCLNCLCKDRKLKGGMRVALPSRASHAISCCSMHPMHPKQRHAPHAPHGLMHFPSAQIQDTPGYGDDLNVERSIKNLVSETQELFWLAVVSRWGQCGG